jgi:hypothetical protein
LFVHNSQQDLCHPTADVMRQALRGRKGRPAGGS